MAQLPQQTPQLDAPGAGIPMHHRMLMRWYVRPRIAATSDWLHNEKLFYKIHGTILNEVSSVPYNKWSAKILIPPQRGLEDSSRFWNLKETLEHIVIVGSGIQSLVVTLSNGEVPASEVDTAKVKPAGQMTPEETLIYFEEYVTSCIGKINAAKGEKLRQLKWPHPWFGPMNAHEWFWLLPIHAGLHLQQIREIKKKLG
ncbi:MAG: DinB family protein [Bdellovibrionaceae bacterium]|nr:DinB family protein [Pseudobdellovibrionaceae bacterium]